MPVWPFFMGAAALLTLVGAFVGAWRVPACALAGYIAIRGVANFAPDQLLELSAGAVWLGVAAAMIHYGGKVPGFFFALSACTYPAFLLFGIRFEYLGIVPIFADGFAILALLFIGGGLAGLVADTRNDGADRMGVEMETPAYTSGYLYRAGAFLLHHSTGVARSEKD